MTTNTNPIDHLSVEFQYPNDEPSPNEQPIDTTALIEKLCIQLISERKPHLMLSALLYSTGYDVGLILGTENTETALARVLGTTKQNFSTVVKRVRVQFNIKYANTGKSEESKEVYKKSNYEPQRIIE